MTNYSLREIIESFEQKKKLEKQFPFAYYFIRPLSFLITYFVIRLTTSPSLIAWVGFVVGWAGCLSFLFISSWSAWPGTILLFAFGVLDGVDGNIARTTGDVTFYGKFLDGLLGNVIDATYCLWIGLGLSGVIPMYLQLEANNVTINAVSPLPLLCGAIIMGGRLLCSLIDSSYTTNSFEKYGNRPKRNIHAAIQTSTFTNKWYYWVFLNINLTDNQIVFLALCVWFDNIAIFLHLLALYYLVRAITFFVFFLIRAKQNLM